MTAPRNTDAPRISERPFGLTPGTVQHADGFTVTRHPDNRIVVSRTDGKTVSAADKRRIELWYWTHVGVPEPGDSER